MEHPNTNIQSKKNEQKQRQDEIENKRKRETSSDLSPSNHIKVIRSDRNNFDNQHSNFL